ncbi:MAG: LuxR C-terminal-related transcriptional regulator [Chloroflexi bacterium]|nr:LuxR C-terminal-related transcriptional regulator [Chloroflexota bacterium]
MEHALLECAEADVAFTMGGDLNQVHKQVQRATVSAAALGLFDLEMVARALEGLVLVVKGRVTEGMRCLDGAATAAFSGEVVDLAMRAYIYCYLLTACEHAHDYGRAEQWAVRVEAYSKRIGSTALFAVSRTHYASVLIGRGAWAEASRILETAAQDFARSRPALAAEPLVRLAALRRRQGRPDEARALLDRLAHHPLAGLELAELDLEQGETKAALHRAERLLRTTPRANRLIRLPALELLVRAQLADGNTRGATTALAALRQITRDTAPALRAIMRLAEGRVALAVGEADRARMAIEDAIDLLDRSGSSVEAARARIELGRCLDALGLSAAAIAEARAALQVLQSIGADGNGRGARALLEARATNASQNGILSRREIEVLRLVAAGESNRSIGATLNVSEFTVKRHMQNILDKLDVPSRAAAAAHAVRHSLL